MTPKIKTLEQVMDSGLPYNWPLQGSGSSQDGHPNPTVREAVKKSINLMESVKNMVISCTGY